MLPNVCRKRYLGNVVFGVLQCAKRTVYPPPEGWGHLEYLVKKAVKKAVSVQ